MDIEKNMPLISFCIPTYMRAKDLRVCLESIVTQRTFDHGDVEIFIFNTICTDGTTEVIEEYKSKYPMIRNLLDTEKIGMPRSLAKVFSEYNGKYIFGLTDDDSLLPGALETLRKKIAENPEVSVFFSGYEFYLEKQQKTMVVQGLDKETSAANFTMEKLAKCFNDSNIFSRTCIKGDFIDKVGLEKYTGSLFVHMYLVAYAGLKGAPYYIGTPLVRHVWENTIYWAYPDDYQLQSYISIMRDLSAINKDFYRPAMALYMETLRPMMNQGYKKSLKFAIELMKIPETRYNLTIWKYLALSMATKIKGKILQ